MWDCLRSLLAVGMRVAPYRGNNQPQTEKGQAMADFKVELPNLSELDNLDLHHLLNEMAENLQAVVVEVGRRVAEEGEKPILTDQVLDYLWHALEDVGAELITDERINRDILKSAMNVLKGK